jgi:orotidine-5'-phosphate decarboxylase
MLDAARTAIETVPRRPLLVGVTMLTSHAPEELASIGLSDGLNEQVERLAGLAHTAGLDGVVCAATEAGRLRARFGAAFALVTPGIRPAGSAADDQRRTLTPREAVQAGADYLVVGRPISRAADPLATLQAVHDDLARGK